MILKLGLYTEGKEIGRKFLVYDNIEYVESVYEKVVVNEKKGGFDFVFDKVAVQVINDPSKEYDLSGNKEVITSFLNLTFRRKDADADGSIYTTNEVYICNDEGQTIEKFRKL